MVMSPASDLAVSVIKFASADNSDKSECKHKHQNQEHDRISVNHFGLPRNLIDKPQTHSPDESL